MQRVVFQTSDHVVLVGTYAAPVGAKRAVLLLHMMPADRTSWSAMQQALGTHGIASLAIDLRGHGESRIQNGRALDYKDFTDEDHRGYLEDAKTALKWLGIRGFTLPHIGLVGASIGANVALSLAADHPEIACAVLFSPGEDYRGIRTFEPASRLLSTQSLWVTASQGDDQESFEAAKGIHERAASKEKQLVPFASSGHGTNMFHLHPDLVSSVPEWIDAHIA